MIIGDEEVGRTIPVEDKTSQRRRRYDQERLPANDREISGKDEKEIVVKKIIYLVGKTFVVSPSVLKRRCFDNF